MLLVAAVIGSISAYLAFNRGKNPYLWFAIGFLFGVLGVFAMFFSSSKKKPLPAPKQPALRLEGPVDKFWYYLDPAHVQQGPMSKDALTQAWKLGKINPSTYIWHEELPEWKPLKESLKLETL
jgi:hypothetical protein